MIDMKKGFTLGEVLIVVAIIALLFTTVAVNWKRQVERGYDSVRKKHLNDIKRAFEEYYNDKGCYPSREVMDTVEDCGSANLQPYLQAVPCDPTKKTPYQYEPNGDPCTGYRAFAGLSDTSDPDIARLGCNGVTGCGFGPGFNYGISSGVPVPSPGFDPGATPTAETTPPAQGGEYACESHESCNRFDRSAGPGCPVKFADEHCCVTEECKACTDASCFKQKFACADPATPLCSPF